MVNSVDNIVRTTMINRISEIPFWGPEEQIRKFINQHDEPNSNDGTFSDGKTQQSITQ